jgi:lysophospholipase L1-like esterase
MQHPSARGKSLRLAVVVLCLIGPYAPGLRAQMAGDSRPGAAAQPPVDHRPAAVRTSGTLAVGDLLAISGDSITEQRIYSADIETYLLACRPALSARVFQFGWSGDTVASLLRRRSDRDVLSIQPGVVTTCFGMNDGDYAPLRPQTVQRYQRNLTTLVQRLKAGHVRLIVVGSPGMVDLDTYNHPGATAAEYNRTLNALRGAARDVAADQDCVFADVYGAMQHAMAQAKARFGAQYHLAGRDGVHPDRNGQLVMAYAFLRALGCDGDLGTIRVDLASGQAQATAGHTVVAANGGKVQIQSSRYPYCFEGAPGDPSGTRDVPDLVAFNADLNRLTLIVNHASAQRLRVTWGEQSRDYTAGELARGVNLAADFASNPFSAPFRAVQAAVRAHQAYQTTMYKSYMGCRRAIERSVNDDRTVIEALGQLDLAMQRHERALAEAAAAAVVPVLHTIDVQPLP